MQLPMGGKITHPWTLLVTVGQEGGFPYTQTLPRPSPSIHIPNVCISAQLQDIYDIVRIILNSPSFRLLERHAVLSTGFQNSKKALDSSNF
jgi:hypothetical protein